MHRIRDAIFQIFLLKNSTKNHDDHFNKVSTSPFQDVTALSVKKMCGILASLIIVPHSILCSVNCLLTNHFMLYVKQTRNIWVLIPPLVGERPPHGFGYKGKTKKLILRIKERVFSGFKYFLVFTPQYQYQIFSTAIILFCDKAITPSPDIVADPPPCRNYSMKNIHKNLS